MSTPTALAVIGGGHMGSAIVRGVVRAAVLDAGRLVVAEPDPARQAPLALEGCRVEASARRALEQAGRDAAVLLAVKPQVFDRVADELGLLDGRLVISVMAGVRAADLARRLQGRVVRLMPNLAVSIGQGVIALSPGPGAAEADVDWVRALISPLGLVEPIDESLMDAFTALAGSGPAYLFYLAEGLIQGAVAAGFSPDVADRVVRQTLRGAAELLAGDEHVSAGEWRARVTSPGGTTAAGIAVLEEAGARQALARAVLAARDRAARLSRA